MRTADLYVRVSTDEQAEKGYSQRNQDEVLRKFCEINRIQVRKVIFEDHSAKTFNRPQWTAMLSELRKQRKKTDLILFTKWDRFSRNAGDAYQMIGILRKLGIEPQAVEQPLDLAVPENKMMLAFYLAAPEVENDRRALNVFHGMRRARKEGRYMGVAPVGYANRIHENGNKYIAINEPNAEIIRWVFEELARGRYAADQVRRMANEKGLVLSRTHFHTEIRNPVYCGKIVVKKYKDEDEYWADGQHEALISEALFYRVQKVLEGRKRNERESAVRIVSLDELPLRGFLHCPDCNRMLTGSASKGRNGYYYYYHCQAACGCRFKANLVNDAFVQELEKYVPREGMVSLYQKIMMDYYRSSTLSVHDGQKELSGQIREQNDKLDRARDLLLANDLEPSDYKEIKVKCEKQVNILEAKLAEVSFNKTSSTSTDRIIYKVIGVLSKLPLTYKEGSISKRRDIIGSIFPEKLVFDGTQHRTGRINEAARLIYLINSKLDQNKNGKADCLKSLSRAVHQEVIEPINLQKKSK